MPNPVEFLRRHWKPVVIGATGLVVAGGGVAAYVESQQSDQPGLGSNAPVIEPGVLGSGGGNEEGSGDVVPPAAGSSGTEPSVAISGCWTAGGVEYYNKGAVTPYTGSECLGGSL